MGIGVPLECLVVDNLFGELAAYNKSILVFAMSEKHL